MTEISRDNMRIQRNREYLRGIGGTAIHNEKHNRVPRLPQLKFLEGEEKIKKNVDNYVKNE